MSTSRPVVEIPNDSKDEALLARLNEWLGTTPDARRHNIFKVPSHFSYGENIDEKLYEPQLVSIGPYHRGKDHLKVMEVDKKLYLQLLLGGPDNVWLDFVTELRKRVPIVRECYAGSFDDITEDAFTEMMILDGCFIVALIRESQGEEMKGKNSDFRSLTPLTLDRVKRDLLLLENQLPFFLLLDLYHMTSGYQRENHFIPMATKFFSGTNGRLRFDPSPTSDAKHLLGLLHDSWFPLREKERLIQEKERLRLIQENGTNNGSLPTSSIPVPFRELVRGGESDENGQFIRSATQLKGAGIKFKKSFIDGTSNGEWVFDIKFDDKGIMSIPNLYVNDDTESILRNLAVYEQVGYKETSSRLVTDYIIIMDCLINTGKDVELLCRRGIIDNWLGDPEVVATMFNRLRQSILINPDDFFYKETFKEVNKHYNKKWNKWRANLHQNYFNTPWSLISVLAAVTLIALAIIQAVYAILSHSRST